GGREIRDAVRPGPRSESSVRVRSKPQPPLPATHSPLYSGAPRRGGAKSNPSRPLPASPSPFVWSTLRRSPAPGAPIGTNQRGTAMFRWWTATPKKTKKPLPVRRRRTTLHLEALEARDCPSASLLDAPLVADPSPSLSPSVTTAPEGTATASGTSP